jgi:hypothetical protein
MWIIYIVLVIINYYFIRAADKYYETKIMKNKWNWSWVHVLITAIFSLTPILSFLIVVISYVFYTIKLPKNPPKWL